MVNIPSMSAKTKDELQPHLFDKTYSNLSHLCAFDSLYIITFSRKSSAGFTALAATGDGNCLYNSISILFFGDERHAALLRLFSIVHACDHFDHYIVTVSPYKY